MAVQHAMNAADQGQDATMLVRAFLVRVEDAAEGFMAPMESEIAYGEQITAGIGFYYFEEGYGSR